MNSNFNSSQPIVEQHVWAKLRPLPVATNLIHIVPLDGCAAIIITAMRWNLIANAMYIFDVGTVKDMLPNALILPFIHGWSFVHENLVFR
jgi:hypothetical protein